MFGFNKFNNNYLTLDDLISKIITYNPSCDKNLIKKAYDFAELAHKDQKRESGDPFMSHPLEVANILTILKFDTTSIICALLHDIVEDTSRSLIDIENNFGKEVAKIVDGLTKLSKITFSSKEEKQAENFRKMIIAMSQDLRVLVIKLADRLHNMRTLQYMSENKQWIIAQETLDIYVPLANRLGINWMKIELEDLCLKYLHQDIYEKIEEKVSKTRDERDKYIEAVKNILLQKLTEYNYKQAEIFGRPKHFYSVYKKMEVRNVEFEQIYDLIAFRIVVDSISECYEVLGILHSIWKPVPGRFKDFIAIPKQNGYQSLHTTLIGLHGERVEVQIRTREMHRIAENGIAAHWIYKEGKPIKETDLEKFNWLKQLIEYQKDLSDSTEFMQSVKIDLFQEEVYVFTPKGDVKEFPKGATPVDFAYSVHTDVGGHCVGAKVNGRIVPLKYKLVNGDTLEIITNENHRPSKDWLKFVVTSKAKAKIRQYIKQEESIQSKALGQDLLEKDLKKYNLSLGRLEKQDKIDSILRAFNCKTVDDLLVGIGYGKISTKDIISRILPEEELKKLELEKQSVLNKFISKLSKKNRNFVKVRGIDDILIKFGKCCDPVYGEQIIGYISRGKGVTIHTTDCQRILEIDPERKVDVAWDEKDKAARKVKIKVICIDQPGILASITKTIASFGGNITQANIKTTRDKKALNQFEVVIEDISHLYNMLKAIEKLKGIITVDRIKG